MQFLTRAQRQSTSVKIAALSAGAVLSMSALAACNAGADLTEETSASETSTTQNATSPTKTSTSEKSSSETSTTQETTTTTESADSDAPTATTEPSGNTSAAGGGVDAQGRPIITVDAIGPFRLGDDASKLQEIGAAQGEQFDACQAWELPGSFADEMRIDTRDGRIIRAVHGSPSGVAGKAGVTDRGITIGSTAGEFRQAYPEATGGTNFYRSPGLWRMYVESDKGHMLVLTFSKEGYTSSDDETMPDDAQLVSMLLTAGNGPGSREIGFMNGDGDCSSSNPWTNTIF